MRSQTNDLTYRSVGATTPWTGSRNQKSMKNHWEIPGIIPIEVCAAELYQNHLWLLVSFKVWATMSILVLIFFERFWKNTMEFNVFIRLRGTIRGERSHQAAGGCPDLETETVQRPEPVYRRWQSESSHVVRSVLMIVFQVQVVKYIFRVQVVNFVWVQVVMGRIWAVTSPRKPMPLLKKPSKSQNQLTKIFKTFCMESHYGENSIQVATMMCTAVFSCLPPDPPPILGAWKHWFTVASCYQTARVHSMKLCDLSIRIFIANS